MSLPLRRLRATSRPGAADATPAATDSPRYQLAGALMVAGAAATWGLWSLCIRPSHLPSTVTGPIIFLVMGLCTLPAALRGPPILWDRTTIALVVANAAFDGLNLLAYFAAMQRTKLEVAVVTHYFAPVLVALAAPRIDRVIAPGAGVGALVSLGGLILMLEPWRAPADGIVTGAALGLVSAVLYAGNAFTTRRIAARIGPARALCYHALVAAVGLAPLAIGQLGALTLGSVSLIAAGALTLGAASGVVYARGLLRIGSARAAVLTFFEPVVAVVVGATAWQEPLSPLAALGGALVLGAGIQVARKAR